MKITKLELVNFKRFSELIIEDIPDTTKLVVLIGSNGCGKSSVFDAFEASNSIIRKNNVFSKQYYCKDTSKNFKVSIEGADFQQVSFENNSRVCNSTLTTETFFGRTSFRQVPRLTRKQFGQNTYDVSTDADRPKYFIDRDVRFENDLEKITELVLKEFFKAQTSSTEIRAKYIDPINNSLARIFSSKESTQLTLLELIPPLNEKVSQVIFRKGVSEIHYDYLSAGEKEIVNVLIDLLVRRDYYNDSIYFFDELDLHLNTAIQATFLKEIVEYWIPDTCQLWVATHSLGFIDYARKSEHAAIIDFDELNFDEPHVLRPEPKENLDVYDIAVPKNVIFDLMKGKRIIFCENKNDRYYNSLLLPNTLFVGVRDSRDVFLKVKNDIRSHSLRDRDFLSDDEIHRIQAKYPQHHILKYYAFENYLYHPDNIAELNIPGFDCATYTAEIVKQKQAQCTYLIAHIVASRMNYEEFKTDEKLKDKEITSIVDDFTSNDFERFYKFFDMKTKFNHSCIATLNLSVEQLSKTNWFKSKIQVIIGA